MGWGLTLLFVAACAFWAARERWLDGEEIVAAGSGLIGVALLAGDLSLVL